MSISSARAPFSAMSQKTPQDVTYWFNNGPGHIVVVGNQHPRRRIDSYCRSMPAGRFLHVYCRHAVNRNVLPSPGLLSTPMSPPISAERCLEMANPRPVPPYIHMIDVTVGLRKRLKDALKLLLWSDPDAGIPDNVGKCSR